MFRKRYLKGRDGRFNSSGLRTYSSCHCLSSRALTHHQAPSDGSILPAEPHPEEGESGAGKTVVGGHREPDLDAMGSLLLWVSPILGSAKRVDSVER